MSRTPYVLTVGIDFGTSFTKVVIQDQVTEVAHVLESGGKWLIPSVVGIEGECFYGPLCCRVDGAIPYLKILAIELLQSENSVACPENLAKLIASIGKCPAIETTLAWYFGNIIAEVKGFIAKSSSWPGFDEARRYVP